MLAIRMQRTGRKGHAQFRVVVQESRFHPTSGRVVAHLGSYNPHTKQATLDNEKISTYLANGAQPSDRVTKLLETEGIKLPKWVKKTPGKKRLVRHPEKRRSTRPNEPVAPQEPEVTTTESAEENVDADLSAESSATEVAEEPKAEEPTSEPESTQTS